MPIVAAGIGLIGGLGGALVGGWLANEGQEKQLKSDRAAAAQELRRDAYGEFVGSADEVALTLLASAPEDEIRSAFRRLLVTKARVLIVAEGNVGVGEAAFLAAETLGRAVDAHNENKGDQKAEELEDIYPADIDHFLDLARDDIVSASE
jgi:hypothetical protein